MGRTGIVKEDILPANTNQALAIVRLQEDSHLNRLYVFYYLRTKNIAKYIDEISVQGAQPNLSLKNISELPIYCPDNQSEQTAIATILSDMDTEIQQLESKMAKYQTIKQGMMQQLLTGSIRLV